MRSKCIHQAIAEHSRGFKLVRARSYWRRLNGFNLARPICPNTWLQDHPSLPCSCPAFPGANEPAAKMACKDLQRSCALSSAM